MADEPDTEPQDIAAKAGAPPLGVRTGASPAGAPLAFHVMAKPTGAVCNLDCAYCFFLSKEMLYPGSRFRMADELLETLYAPAARGARGARGGGRLAGRRADDDGPGLLPAVYRAGRRSSPRPGQRVPTRSRRTAPCSTTSGAGSSTRTTSWSASRIDGPREMHDAYRVDKGGKPTFDRVMRGLDVLRRTRSTGTC